MSQREEFEAWVLNDSPFKRFSDPGPLARRDRGNFAGEYFYAHVEGGWSAWQAAYAAGLERAAWVCESMATYCDDTDECAAAIRSLKTQEPA